MNSTINVLMVGSSTKVKGGMTTVVQSFLQHKFSDRIQLDYISTHSEKGKVYNVLYFAKSLVRIVFHIIVKQPRIIHMHMSERGSFVRKYIIFKISKVFNKKVIIHTHGAEFKEYYLAAPMKTKKRIIDLLKNADKVIALGKSWETILQDIEPEADTAVLMNSVAIPRYEKKDTSKTTFNILFLAVLIERKGILDLIEASIPLIKEASRQNKKVLFQIAGDGALLKTAQELVESLEIKESFNFKGWVGEKEKRKLLKDTDLFVLPSYNEGLPLSILEALSYGIPVISTEVGSINEAVKDGENGYLIQPGNVAALSAAMLNVMNSQSIEDMGNASRKLAEDKFSNENYFKQVERLYLEEIQ